MFAGFQWQKGSINKNFVVPVAPGEWTESSWWKEARSGLSQDEEDEMFSLEST